MAAIRAHFPDHSILSEESGALTGKGAYTWIIDPLDGTVNFWHGLPFFCVSIACYRNGGCSPDAHAGLAGEPVIGVVFLPFSQELFTARSGRGAFLNDRPIGAGRIERAGDAVVAVSFGKTPETMQRMTRRLDVLLPQIRKARCLGAAAAELAYVAAGFLHGLVYEGIKLWDFAAGKIILEEAGGFLNAVETAPEQWRVLAGGSGLQDTLQRLL
jgi:fructose-1,6-bisphosphatase/inositol monophosphatase family enzyme